MEPRTGMRITGQLILGLAIAVLGVLFTLDNLHVLRARDFLQFWPVVPIAIGLARVVYARTPAGVMNGAIWIVVGAALLGNRLGWTHINLLNYWPLLLVMVGGRIVLQAMSPDARLLGGGVDGSAVVSAVAVMGGFDRKVVSNQFRGGEVTAFMGGGKLDLRDAKPLDGQAVINVFALMGGYEIFVPDTWHVVVEVTAFMGGVEDKTRPASDPAAPRLRLRGFVMMGGVEIRN